MNEPIHNFAAGPGVLPAPVIAEIREDLPHLGGHGTSILEMSHRTPPFEAIITEAEANLRSLLGIPDGYRVLFLQGGATLQFAMVPFNFLQGAGRPADYVIAGTWGKKASEDARKAGKVQVAWNGEPLGFSRMPGQSELLLDPKAAYVHITSNETIEGVALFDFPNTGAVPLVCDASSDFLARPLDVSRFGLLYAGAQKNAGAAGVTIVILSEAMLESAPADRFAMLSYKAQAAGKSMHNTPPCFSVYVVMLVTRWLRDTIGGLEAMSALNTRKAGIVYDAIARSGGFYRAHADRASRSEMNVSIVATAS